MRSQQGVLRCVRSDSEHKGEQFKRLRTANKLIELDRAQSSFDNDKQTKRATRFGCDTGGWQTSHTQVFCNSVGINHNSFSKS